MFIQHNAMKMNVITLIILISIIIMLLTLFYALIRSCISIGGSAPHPQAKFAPEDNIVYIVDNNAKLKSAG